MSAIEHRRTRIPGLIDPEALSCVPVITGMVLRLSMTLGLWQDAGKTTPAVGDDLVYTWEDLSGNGNDFVQSTEAARPIVRADVSGTLDALEFDGSNDVLRLGSALYGNTATVFIVCYLSSATEKGAMFGIGTNSNGWKIGVGGSSFDNTGNDLIMLFDNVKWIDTGDLIGTGVHLVTVRMTTGAPEWWIDGVASGSTTGTPNAATAITTVGGDGPSARFYTDHLCEVIASSSAISDAQRGAMEAYLMGLYGIS